MTYYVRYAVTDDKPIILSEIEKGLQQVNPGYEIDADYLILEGQEYGQIDISLPGSDLFEDDLELMRAFAEEKEKHEFLLSELQKVTSLIVVQAIWSNDRTETLKVIEGMFEWLMNNHKGVLMDEGGAFYRATGLEVT